MKYMQIEGLENRRLLSFIPFTPARGIPGAERNVGFGCAVADDHSFLFARQTTQQTLELTRFSATGELIQSPQTVAANLDQHSGVSLDCDPAGDAVVAYISGSALYFRRISKQGQVSAAVKVSSPVKEFGSQMVSMDDSGGFFVGWEDQMMRAYTANGIARGDAFVASSGEFALPVNDLHIAALPDGSGALYARDFSNDTSGLVAIGHASPVAPSGDLKPLPGAAYLAGLAVYPDGSFVIGYDTNQDPNGEPFDVVRVFGADGTPRTQPISLSKLLGDASLPVGGVSLQTISDGGFVASFYAGIGGPKKIYAARFHGDGSIETGPIELGARGYPSIHAASDGTTVVNWYVVDGFAQYRRLTTDFAAIDRSELYVLGSPSANTISVSSKSGKITATSGTKERNFAAAGIDAMTVNAYDGADSISSSLSIPTTIQGGTGSDFISVGKIAAKVLVSGQDGNDTITISDETAATVYGGNGSDSLLGRQDGLSGGPADKYFDGQSGDDRIDAGAGNDRLFGGAGDDHLIGNAGNDSLDGGAGKDWLEGGLGNDMFYSVDNEHDRLFGGRGDDSARIDRNLDFVDGVETVT